MVPPSALAFRPFLAALLALGLRAGEPGVLDGGDGQTWVPAATCRDPAGQTPIRYQHRFRGLRILGSQLILHPQARVDARGLPGPDPGDPEWADPVWTARLLGRADLEPALDPEAARAVAAKDQEGRATEADPERVLVPRLGSGRGAADAPRRLLGYRLAYRVRVLDPAGEADLDVLVDAHRGRILGRLPLAEEDEPAQGVGHTFYSGQVALGSTATATGFLLVDPVRNLSVLDLGHGDGRSPGQVFFNYFTTGNTWGDGKAELPGARPDRPNGQTLAADAAFGVANAYDFFLRILGWKGLDGQGLGTRVRVHVRDPRYLQKPQAIYHLSSGAISVFEPDPPQLPAADPRALAHEWTHGVVQHTAGLDLEPESLALNEATADIFGLCADTWFRSGRGGTIGKPATWTMDLYQLDAQGGLERRVRRDFIDPPANGYSLAAYDPALGKLDPHFGAGPMERAFYFLAEGASRDPHAPSHSAFLPGGMRGIGIDAAARIWFEALVAYLQPNSDYLRAREAALRAAALLHGADSPQERAVARAFAAIHVGSPRALAPDSAQAVVRLAAQVHGPRLAFSLATGGELHDLKEVRYLVDGAVVAIARHPPFDLTVDLGRLLADGTHRLSAEVTDHQGRPRPVEGADFQVAARFPQLIQDPAFQQEEDSPWEGVEDPDQAFAPQGHEHIFGTAAAFALWPSAIAQTVTIPADAAYAQLEVWLTAERDARARPGEAFTLQVTEPLPLGGGEPRVLATLDRLPAERIARPGLPAAWLPAAYLPWTYDLARFRGQRVRLVFAGNVEPYSGTMILLDDVTLECGPAPPGQVRVRPASALALPGTATAAFQASVRGLADPALRWRVKAGDDGVLGPDRRYHAPPSPGIRHVEAVSAADPAVAGEAMVVVPPPIVVEPPALWLAPGARGELRVQAAPGVDPGAKLDGAPGSGRLNRNGRGLVYTAPPQPGSYHLRIGDRARRAATVTVPITVAAPSGLAVTPRTRVLAVGAALDFQAGPAPEGGAEFKWFLDEWPQGGRLEPREGGGACRYQAPQVPGTYHLRAFSAQAGHPGAVAAVTVVDGAAVDPPRVRLRPGESFQFQATRPGGAEGALSWRIPEGDAGGRVDGTGRYTAPAAPGTYHVEADSLFFPPGTAEVVVTP